MQKIRNIKKIKFFPFYGLSLAPMPVLYFLSDIVFVFLYHVIQYRRNVVRHNLRNAFPDKTGKEIEDIARKFYRHFCDIMVETLKSLTISREDAIKRFNVKNPELIEKYYRENKSIILYTAHQGNWEWLGFLPLLLPHQITSFYQPLSNKYFNTLMKMIRERFGTVCIESGKGYRVMMQFAQKNITTLNMIIGDQSPVREHDKYWTEFLNQETAFLTGAGRIAQKANQVAIFSSFTKKGRGSYELEFKLITENPRNEERHGITSTYTKLLERAILKSPEMWLWTHRRWKLSRVTSEGAGKMTTSGCRV